MRVPTGRMRGVRRASRSASVLAAGALAAALPAAAQATTLRAAVVELDTATAVAGTIETSTACAPRRCEFVHPAKKVPTRSGGATLALGAALGAGLGAALARDDERRPVAPLARFGWRDVAIIGAAGLAWRLHGWPHREPGESGRGRFSDCAVDDDTLNAFDRAARRALGGAQATHVCDLRRALRRRERFAHASDLTLHATWAQPLGFLLAHGGPARMRDVLVHAEAAAVALALTEISKHTFHRPRPFAHFCEPLDAPALGDDDARLSFFSGHTATAFATATAGWRLAQMRGYRHAGRLKAGGLALATTTGVLRIAADKHYLTDVLVGAAAGWGAGYLVTRLHRPERESAATATPSARSGEAAAALTPSGGVALGLARGTRLQLGFAAGGPAFALQGSF